MSAVNQVTALIQNNSADVEAIVKRIGIGNLIAMTPALLRIADTMSKAKDPEETAERITQALYYNEATKERIAAFQKKHGLHADGLVGDRTWKKVEDLLAEKKDA